MKPRFDFTALIVQDKLSIGYRVKQFLVYSVRILKILKEYYVSSDDKLYKSYLG